jgi:hypothetical protein
VPYEQSLEALNRDSTKLMAEKFNQVKGDQQTKANFIFLSAEPSIIPLPSFIKYY